MKIKFKQRLSTLAPTPTKRIITSDLNLLNTKRTITSDLNLLNTKRTITSHRNLLNTKREPTTLADGNQILGLGQALKYGGVKHVNVITTLPF
jgi:hypothetical protein